MKSNQNELIMKTADAVRRIQSGDEAAWTEVYDLTRNTVYYRLKVSNIPEREIEDLMQEIYIKIFENIQNQREPQTALKWINRIATNTAADHYRKSTVKHETLVTTKEDDEDADDFFDREDDFMVPEAIMENEDLQREVREILHSLPKNQYEALAEFYFNERSISEIAEMRGVPEGSVKSDLSRGRKAFREKVETLEKKYGKLFSIAPIVLLGFLFGEEAYATAVPKAISESVTQTLVQKVPVCGARGQGVNHVEIDASQGSSAETAAGTAGETSGTAAGASGKAAGAAAAAGKAAGVSAGVKVAALVAGIVGVGVITGAVIMNQPFSVNKQGSSVSEEMALTNEAGEGTEETAATGDIGESEDSTETQASDDAKQASGSENAETEPFSKYEEFYKALEDFGNYEIAGKPINSWNYEKLRAYITDHSTMEEKQPVYGEDGNQIAGEYVVWGQLDSLEQGEYEYWENKPVAGLSYGPYLPDNGSCEYNFNSMVDSETGKENGLSYLCFGADGRSGIMEMDLQTVLNTFHMDELGQFYEEQNGGEGVKAIVLDNGYHIVMSTGEMGATFTIGEVGGRAYSIVTYEGALPILYQIFWDWTGYTALNTSEAQQVGSANEELLAYAYPMVMEDFSGYEDHGDYFTVHTTICEPYYLKSGEFEKMKVGDTVTISGETFRKIIDPDPDSSIGEVLVKDGDQLFCSNEYSQKMKGEAPEDFYPPSESYMYVEGYDQIMGCGYVGDPMGNLVVTHEIIPDYELKIRKDAVITYWQGGVSERQSFLAEPILSGGQELPDVIAMLWAHLLLDEDGYVKEIAQIYQS